MRLWPLSEGFSPSEVHFEIFCNVVFVVILFPFLFVEELQALEVYSQSGSGLSCVALRQGSTRRRTRSLSALIVPQGKRTKCLGARSFCRHIKKSEKGKFDLSSRYLEVDSVIADAFHDAALLGDDSLTLACLGKKKTKELLSGNSLKKEIVTTKKGFKRGELGAFSLRDSKTGLPIEQYSSFTGDKTVKPLSVNIDRVALTASFKKRGVKKVKFFQDGALVKTELTEPFSFSGDKFGVLNPLYVKNNKTYRIEAVAFNRKEQEVGRITTALTFKGGEQFDASLNAISSLTLLYPDSGLPVDQYVPISDALAVDLSALSQPFVDFKVNVLDNSVKSVVFGLNQSGSIRTVNDSPFTFSGQKNGGIKGWFAPEGKNEIHVIGYSGRNGKGQVLGKKSFLLTFYKKTVNQAEPTKVVPPEQPKPTTTGTQEVVPTENPIVTIEVKQTATPNPTPLQTPLPTATPTLTIGNPQGVLYFGALRPPSGVVSVASGQASMKMSQDSQYGLLTLTYSNLSSGLTAAHLHAPDNTIILDLDEGVEYHNGKIVWRVGPAGKYSATQILKFFKEGTCYVNIHTAKYPMGEITSTLKPVLIETEDDDDDPGNAILNKEDAFRIMQQIAIGGGYIQDIEDARGKSAAFFVEEELSASACYTFDKFQDYVAEYKPNGGNYFSKAWEAAWWDCVLNGDSDLRTKVAFILSQILVVGRDGFDYEVNRNTSVSAYFDVLTSHAFGNFRTILEEVTLSAPMGAYLNMANNAKAEKAGELPNENYAREILQLFSIGLVELDEKGAIRLDSDGFPLETYSTKDIEELSRVFTGWTWSNYSGWGRKYPVNNKWNDKMVARENKHDNGAKSYLNGRCVHPENLTALEDLKLALDCIFNHPNVGPFISRRLIQFLVTSNPSSGYVRRVAEVFNDNGNNIRGDMKSVLRAILLDAEARSLSRRQRISYGRAKAPIEVAAGFFKLLGSRSQILGLNAFELDKKVTLQAPLDSPTVFNWFEPDYSRYGLVAMSGLYSPEMKLFDSPALVTLVNGLWSIIVKGKYQRGSDVYAFDYTDLEHRAESVDEFVDHLDFFFTGSQLSNEHKELLISDIQSISDKKVRVHRAVAAIVGSSEFLFQR